MKRKWAELLAAPVLVAVAMWPVAQAVKQARLDNALFSAAGAQYPDPAKVQQLISEGANANSYRASMTPLHRATEGSNYGRNHGSFAIARSLLQHGVDVNAADANGKTALMQAAQNGDAEIVRLLLSYGAAVNVRDHDNRTVLDWIPPQNRTDKIPELAQDYAKIRRLLKNAGARATVVK